MIYPSGRDAALAMVKKGLDAPMGQKENQLYSYAARQIVNSGMADRYNLQKKSDNLPSSAITLKNYQRSEQQNQIMDNLAAVDNRMLEAAKEYRKDKNAKYKRVSLMDVSDREAADILRLTGQNVTGYTHEADKNFFVHTENRHGEHGKSDHSMSDLNDVARVAWVIKFYDTIEWNGDVSYGYIDKNGSQMPKLLYKKQIDGTLYVVEAVGENKWGKLHLVTARIQKNHSTNESQNGTVTHTSNVTSPGLNVRNAYASPVDNSVAKESENVNDRFSLKTNTGSEENRALFENAKKIFGTTFNWNTA